MNAYASRAFILKQIRQSLIDPVQYQEDVFLLKFQEDQISEV